MRIQNVSKICAAVACALTLSANAADLRVDDARTLAQGFMSDDVNHILGLNGTKSEMRAVKTIKAGDVTKVRFQQYYNGYPVFGYSVAASKNPMGLLHDVRGKVLDFSGVMMPRAMRVKADEALAKAKKGDKALSINPKAKVYNEEKETFVFIQDGKPRMAHRVSFVVDGKDGPSRPVHFIDALTGESLLSYDNLQHANATGPGGNTKTGQYNYGTDFGYMNVAQSGSTCTMNNSDVKTVNLNHSTSGSSAHSFTCPENTVKSINGAYSPLNDAHYFGQVVFDMFNAWVGSPPLTFQLTMRVHYSNNYENAFWDGSAMTFGDGASTFYPLVSLDVSSHEVAHGFTEQNSSLVYSGMSGGMNEAFSDMAGEAAENYMHGSNDWQVGADIFKGTGALRYMQNPPDDGRSIGHADDFTSSMDVHYSSGVFNKAFYLLSTTSGWSVQTAFKTMALANQTYWTANSTFDAGACGVESAAGDLGYTVADVTSAFAAVGVACGGTGGGGGTGGNYDVGGTVDNISVNRRKWQRYTLDVPAGSSALGLHMSGGTGDADLYVRFGSQPSTSNYDCRPYLTGNNEDCTFTNPAAGTWHIGIRGYTSASGISLAWGYNN